jgi:hypothetical protein
MLQKADGTAWTDEDHFVLGFDANGAGGTHLADIAPGLRFERAVEFVFRYAPLLDEREALACSTRSGRGSTRLPRTDGACVRDRFLNGTMTAWVVTDYSYFVRMNMHSYKVYGMYLPAPPEQTRLAWGHGKPADSQVGFGACVCVSFVCTEYQSVSCSWITDTESTTFYPFTQIIKYSTSIPINIPSDPGFGYAPYEAFVVPFARGTSDPLDPDYDSFAMFNYAGPYVHVLRALLPRLHLHLCVCGRTLTDGRGRC